MQIDMVDLKGQYNKIKGEINEAILSCVATTSSVNWPAVNEFQHSLENYLNVKHVIPCANGTDSLQISMMALLHVLKVVKIFSSKMVEFLEYYKYE